MERYEHDRLAMTRHNEVQTFGDAAQVRMIEQVSKAVEANGFNKKMGLHLLFVSSFLLYALTQCS